MKKGEKWPDQKEWDTLTYGTHLIERIKWIYLKVYENFVKTISDSIQWMKFDNRGSRAVAAMIEWYIISLEFSLRK